MTQSIYDKWATITGSMSGDRGNWLDQYSSNQSLGIDFGSMSTYNSQSFPSVLPLVRRVASSLLAGVDYEKIEEVKIRIKSENRDGKIGSIVDGQEYTEKKIEDDPEYKIAIESSIVSVQPSSMPSGHLFYMDFIYATSS